MKIRDPYHDMPRIPHWERAKETFTRRGGCKYVRTISLHRLGNKDYTLRWYPEKDEYALQLAGTNVINYETPLLLGGYRVRVLNPNRKNMNAFFSHHGWQSWTPRLKTTDDKWVVAPLVPHRESLLAFDAERKLILAESHHGDLYGMYSDDDLKEQIAALHQKVEPLLNLCMMRVDEYLQSADVIYRYANRTFAGIDMDMYVGEKGGFGRARDIIYNHLLKRDPSLDEATILAFLAVTEEIVKFKLSKLWAKTGSTLEGSRFEKAKAAVSVDSIRTSLQYVCTKLMRLDKPNAKREIPQFPSKLPRRVFL